MVEDESGRSRLTHGVDSDRAEGSAARNAAWRVLTAWRKDRWVNGRSLIERMIHTMSLDDRDVDLATELVMGVIRHRLTLARVLGCFTDRGWGRVHSNLKDILLLGAYQVIWLDGIPEFAAVHEAVELAKRELGPKAGRFANAVLREMLRQIEHRRISSPMAVRERSVPVSHDVSLQFRIPVMPDPAVNLDEYLAFATSHPPELVSRWLPRHGQSKTEALCFAGTCRPPAVFRPNSLKTTARQLADSLRSEGVLAEVTSDGRRVVAPTGPAVSRLAAFRDGWFQPQDRTAGEVVERMELKPGETVIDLCAGLGTKTTQMAEMMRGEGTILASDKDASKLVKLMENAARLSLGGVRTCKWQELQAESRQLSRIDWIVCDAPCSNTGVLARRPEARYRVSETALHELAGIQMELLTLAHELARPETRLAYSTCSIEPEENEGVIQGFAAAFPEWRLESSDLILPHAGSTFNDWHDGGYWALWTRT